MVPRNNEARGEVFAALWRCMLVLGMALLMLSAGCISYPNCENDDHCAEKGEFCLQGKCAKCRLDSHCDEGNKCVAGVCEPIPGFCKGASDCQEGERCRDNRCTDQCFGNDDCGEGQICKAGKCIAGVCATDADCPDGQTCRDNQCVAVAAAANACDNMAPVYFDFDESTLRADSRDALSGHADCIKKRGSTLLIEGHCDERGTEEYNLSLGERRAKTTRDYIVQLGVQRNRLKTISYGESKPAKFGSAESVYQLNRRCEFKWQ